MSNLTALQRGAIIFGILVVVMGLCFWITFTVLPATGSSVALPVIVVPGEPYNEQFTLLGLMWTNTLTAMLLADIMVLIFVALAWRSSKGWTAKVPGRFQVLAEVVGGFMYGQSKNIAGKNASRIFPLVGTIFVFLLAVNWMKLLPGIESVGAMHCAGHSNPEIGISITAGHPKVGDRLLVTQPLFSGYAADEDDYHACELYKEGETPKPTQEALNAAADLLAEEEAALRTELTAQLNAGEITQAEFDSQIAALRLEVTESVWEHASVGFPAEILRDKNAVPYLFVVTPYVRGGSTDLNLTIGLALISFFAIQVYGVWAQGPAYFIKFINLPALGNLSKKPLGAVDFIVGVFEIVSEFGKIISLSFRLFGNMFAGGILLAVMSFLVAFFLPGVFIGLEIIVTTIQAYVFAILTLVFSAQAMEGHHGDEEHHDEAHAH
ncbi:MAG: F0F1 ATP synthase subunit A [Chloroflexi bacterium]|nr:F0F1 ATP synthase subunit A [Chloroflexota bacterium]